MFQQVSKLFIFDEKKQEFIGELLLNSKTNLLSLNFYKRKYIDWNPLFPNNKKDSYVIENYLSNIIPEGNALKIFLNRHQLTEYDLFKIVKIIKNDFSGRFSFHQSKDEINLFNEKEDLYLSDLTIYEKIKKERQKAGNLIIWDEEVRLSVAGFQPKLNLFIKEESGKLKSYLPLQNKSNYIMKINSSVEDDVILNEYFYLKLAKSLKSLQILNLEVSDCFFKEILDEQVLFVKRFDREELKQVIDGAILLNEHCSNKYQSNLNKTSLNNLVLNFNRYLPENLRDIESEKFLGLILFNLFINNYDLHAKNISFFYEDGELKLAPLYDLVNIDLYDLNKEYGLHIGNASTKSKVNFNDLKHLGSMFKIPEIRFKEIFNNISNEIIELNLSDIKFDKEFDFNKHKERLEIFLNSAKNTTLYFKNKFEVKNELTKELNSILKKDFK